MDYRQKGTLILISLLEDLARESNQNRFIQPTPGIFDSLPIAPSQKKTRGEHQLSRHLWRRVAQLPGVTIYGPSPEDQPALRANGRRGIVGKPDMAMAVPLK